jgi:putative endonuclease
MNVSPHIKVGKLGESIAKRFLMRKGYRIIAKNYSRKWGEIDLIAQNGEFLNFIEVKTVSREIHDGNSVSRETNNRYMPEDNMHPEKIRRLRNIISTYLMDSNYEGDWTFSLVAIEVDSCSKYAKVRFVEDIALG